jgi:ATP-dependent DNA helicase RecQ
MPRSVEAYYQEIGRAGRDGVAADCVLFYSYADVLGYDRLITDSPAEVQERQRARIREMYDWAESGRCRHAALVGYFGERIEPCGKSCDICSGNVLRPLTQAAFADAPARVRAPRMPIASVASDALDDDADAALFQSLRALRKKLADARGVPAYVVLSDATLLEIARRRPTNEDELRSISGIGPKKLAQYGSTLLSAIASA